MVPFRVAETSGAKAIRKNNVATSTEDPSAPGCRSAMHEQLPHLDGFLSEGL